MVAVPFRSCGAGLVRGHDSYKHCAPTELKLWLQLCRGEIVFSKTPAALREVELAAPLKVKAISNKQPEGRIR